MLILLSLFLHRFLKLLLVILFFKAKLILIFNNKIIYEMNKFKLSFTIIIAILIGTIFIGCEKENELISSRNEAEKN